MRFPPDAARADAPEGGWKPVAQGIGAKGKIARSPLQRGSNKTAGERSGGDGLERSRLLPEPAPEPPPADAQAPLPAMSRASATRTVGPALVTRLLVAWRRG